MARRLMQKASSGMEQSLMFIPRTVTRKPAQKKDIQATSTTKPKENSNELTCDKTKASEDEVHLCKETKETSLKHVSDISQRKDSLLDLRTSSSTEIFLDKSLDKTEVTTQVLDEKTCKESNDKITGDKLTKCSVAEEKEINTTVHSTEKSTFSFMSFAEAVCKHNNLDPSWKENQPLTGIDVSSASTSTSADISETIQSSEHSFSFSSFAQAVYKQSNLPLIDVGALSPKRKIPCFIRQKTPNMFLQQPAFNPTGVETSREGPFSYLAGKHDERKLQDVGHGSSPSGKEPAAKRFKHVPKSTKRNPEHSFGLPRDWELTQCGRRYYRKPMSERGLDFTVMSYNILAQNLLEDNRYLYTDCDEYILRWKYRKRQLMAELKHHRPDVICLQEVQKTHYEDFFKPELQKLGYSSAFVKRSGNKQDGCATFVNRSKFHLEKSVPIEYYHRKGGSVLDRDNVALIVKLKPLSEHVPPERRVCVANTHLLFNPRRGDVKLAQLMVLLAELDKCGFISDSMEEKYHGVILCGDFNSEPHSELYKLMTMGKLNYEGLLCRVVSGQQEGLHRGNNIYLGRRFIPEEVGISDNCQYLEVLDSRTSRSKVKHSDETIDLTEDSTHRSKVKHSEETIDLTDDSTQDSDIKMTGSQGTGTLSHNLNLVSAYNHRISRLRHRHREVTTFHNRASCTVDYIFYGVQCKDVRFRNDEVEMRNIEEGCLRLLGRYGLLANHELQEMGGLPNESLASDHVSLLTSFLLR